MELEKRRPLFCSYAKIQGLFTQLIVLLTRSLQDNPNQEGNLPSRVNDERRILIIEQFFANYQKNLTIEMLASQLHLSPRQTNRILNRYYNKTFKKKLLETRIEVSKFLLRTSNLPVEQIADYVGYTTSYFFRFFSKNTGMTPAAYRAMHRLSMTDNTF